MHIKDLFNITGKVAIVTGGAGYYGHAISVALAEAGAQVIVASRNSAKCIQFAETLKNRGLASEGMELDLSEDQSINNLIDTVMDRYKRIDILVNNAVSRNGLKDLDALSREDWERAQNVNSTGLMLITQAAIEQMCEQRSGCIINIGSIQGVVGPNFGVYGDTGMTSPLNYTYDKWAIVGFTKWIANKYGKYNIRANCISPGGYGPGVRDMLGKNEFYENYIRLTPLGRFAEEDDIKGPVLFLASEAAAYVTGHNLLVDGGWTSW